MARPLTRAQTLENAAFLKDLRRTGNVRLAARAIGKAYGTMEYRRANHPAFAVRWDIAVTSAAARLYAKGGRKGPEARDPAADGAHRTAGGEPVVVRLRNGRLQVRAAQPGKLTRQCEQAFLLALSATCNLRLAAAAAGASEAAFNRRRHRNPAFAREVRLALAEGYRRLEETLLSTLSPSTHEDDAWRHNDLPDLPPMTANQMLQLMYLHQKEALLGSTYAYLQRRRPGEPEAVLSARVQAEYQTRLRREAEDYMAGEVDRLAARLARSPHEVPVTLPALDQVKWSKADPAKGGHHDDRALFGGWRMEDLTQEERESGRRKGQRRGR